MAGGPHGGRYQDGVQSAPEPPIRGLPSAGIDQKPNPDAVRQRFHPQKRGHLRHQSRAQHPATAGHEGRAVHGWHFTERTSAEEFQDGLSTLPGHRPGNIYGPSPAAAGKTTAGHAQTHLGIHTQPWDESNTGGSSPPVVDWISDDPALRRRGSNGRPIRRRSWP